MFLSCWPSTVCWRRAALAAAALLLLGCGQDLNSFSDPENTFTLRYPKTWKVVREGRGTVFTPPGEGPRASLVITVVARREGAVTRTESSAMAGLVAQYQELAGYALLGSAPAFLGGRVGWLFSVVFKHQGLGYRKDHYIIPLRQKLL